jgi:hypothetical protein
MLKIETTLTVSYLCGCVALVLAIAEPASAITAAGSGCGDSLAYTAFMSVASSGNAGSGSLGATAESGSANGCQEATGSCDGSPCGSITCTFTMNDATVSSLPYTVNPPLSNSGCATTFCRSKCE